MASLCFPSFPRFCGQIFHEAKDKDLALLCVQAYNDWMIDEWCGAAPGRFIPVTIIPLWDPRLAATEMERCAGLGARGFSFSENPVHLNLPSIHDGEEYWRPVIAAAAETGMVVCTHIGSSSRLPVTSEDAPAFVSQTMLGYVNPSGALLDWLFSGWFQEFPTLKLALSEGGIGWMPYVIEHAEYVLRRHRYWAAASAKSWMVRARRHESGAPQHHVEGLRRTVDYDSIDIRQSFRDHVYGCFIDDGHGVRSIDELGIDNIMIETDYPHSDSTWPNCIQHARKQIAALSPADQYKILRSNAERIFRLDPPDPVALGLRSPI